MLLKIYNVLNAVIAAIKTLPGLYKVKKMDNDNMQYKKNKLIYMVTNKFGNDVIKGSRANIIVEGLENNKISDTMLFVSNHQSNYDIPLLLSVVPRQIGFISKIELKKMPIAGDWITEMNGVFMDRDDKKQSLQAIKEGILKLKEGHCLVIFPEGTRSKGPNINDFKGGSLSLAKNANVPIVPIAIDGTYKIGKEKRPTIRITFLNPIFIKKEDNLNVVANDIKNSIVETIEKNKVYTKSKLVNI